MSSPGLVDIAVVFTAMNGTGPNTTVMYDIWYNGTSGSGCVVIAPITPPHCTVLVSRKAVFTHSATGCRYADFVSDADDFVRTRLRTNPRVLSLQQAVDAAILRRAAGTDASAPVSDTLHTAVELLPDPNRNKDTVSMTLTIGPLFLVLGLTVDCIVLLFLITGEKQAHLLGSLRRLVQCGAHILGTGGMWLTLLCHARCWNVHCVGYCGGGGGGVFSMGLWDSVYWLSWLVNYCILCIPAALGALAAGHIADMLVFTQCNMLVSWCGA